MKVIGIDSGGTVRLVGSGGDVSNIPNIWNGMVLTAFALTLEQEAAFDSLPPDRSGTTFDGAQFVALPPVPAQVLKSAGMLAFDAIKADPAALAALKAELAK